MIKQFIKEHPNLSAATIGALIVCIGIIGLSGSIWPGILVFGSYIIFVAAMMGDL